MLAISRPSKTSTSLTSKAWRQFKAVATGEVPAALEIRGELQIGLAAQQGQRGDQPNQQTLLLSGIYEELDQVRITINGEIINYQVEAEDLTGMAKVAAE